METKKSGIKNQISVKLLIHAVWVRSITLVLTLLMYVGYKFDSIYFHYFLLSIHLSVILVSAYIYVINIKKSKQRFLIALSLVLSTFIADVLSTGFAAQWSLDLFLVLEANPIMRMISLEYPFISLVNILLFKFYIHLIMFLNYLALPELQYLYSLSDPIDELSKLELFFYELGFKQRLWEPLSITKAYLKKRRIQFSPAMIYSLLTDGLVNTVVITFVFLLVSLNNVMVGLYVAGDVFFNFVSSRWYLLSVFGLIGAVFIFITFLAYPVTLRIVKKRIIQTPDFL